MPLVTLKCPNCNGNLQFEDTKECGQCPFCGVSIIIDNDRGAIARRHELKSTGATQSADKESKPRIGVKNESNSLLKFVIENRFLLVVILLVSGMAMSIIGLLDFIELYNWGLPEVDLFTKKLNVNVVMLFGWILIIVTLAIGYFLEYNEATIETRGEN
jgi:hypothetical protein